MTAALHFMITSAAKHNTDYSALIQELQQLGFPQENANVIGKSYHEVKEALQARLSEDTYRVSQLVRTSWRVDAILGSKGKENSLDATTYFRLHVDIKPNGIQSSGTSIDIDRENQNRFQDLSSEVSPEKLEVLIHELTKAKDILNRLNS
jgi:hypothetical protein